MTADAGLVVSRFVHFTALLFAFGVGFFPLYASARSEPAALLNIRSRFKTGLLSACLIALASGLFWLVFTAASMADSLSEALGPSTLTDILGESGFGGECGSFTLPSLSPFVFSQASNAGDGPPLRLG